MKKKYFFLALVTALVVTGCTTSRPPVDTGQNVSGRDNAGGAATTTKPNIPENAAKGTIGDLAIGQTVSVFGTENDDGSVSAAQIMIGNLPPGPGGVGLGDQSSTATAPLLERREGNSMQPPSGGNRFVSGSDKKEMPAPRAGVAWARGGQGTVHISGEIVAIDEQSIVLKLTAGGSKIVFFSNEMTVLIFPDVQQ